MPALEPLVSIITNIIMPLVISIAVLSRISKARNNEKLYYALIGVLAIKNVLDTEDLVKLQLFEPSNDMLDIMTGFFGK